MARIRSVSLSSKDRDIKDYFDPEKTPDFSGLVKELLREYKKRGGSRSGSITREEIKELIKEVLKDQAGAAPTQLQREPSQDPEIMEALGDIFKMTEN